MRQIGSEENLEKKRKRNAVIVGVLMLAIMVISSAGYAFLTGSENEQDTGSKVVNGVENRGSYWVFQFEGQELYVSSSPEEVRNISIDLGYMTLDKYRQKALYISSNNTGMSGEIGSTLGKFTPRAQAACYGNCSENLPVKDCYDNLIVWKESAQNKVYTNQSCIFIDGDLKAVDAFIYKIFGIN